MNLEIDHKLPKFLQVLSMFSKELFVGEVGSHIFLFFSSGSRKKTRRRLNTLVSENPKYL